MELTNAIKKQLVHEFGHISQHLTGIYFTVKSKSRMKKPGWNWAVCHMTPSLGAAFSSSALTQSGRCSLKRPLSFLVGTPYTSKGEANLCSDLGGLGEVTRGRRLLTPPPLPLYCSTTEG